MPALLLVCQFLNTTTQHMRQHKAVFSINRTLYLDQMKNWFFDPCCWGDFLLSGVDIAMHGERGGAVEPMFSALFVNSGTSPSGVWWERRDKKTIQAQCLGDRLFACVRVGAWPPMKISSFLLISDLISAAGSETDIKWNRLPKSSFIDHPGPQHPEGGREVGREEWWKDE